MTSSRNGLAQAADGSYAGGVDSYGQYCPVAKAAEIVAERWTPLILRELLAESHHFNELQRGLPTIPRSVLAQRLRRLEAVGVIERRVGGRLGEANAVILCAPGWRH